MPTTWADVQAAQRRLAKKLKELSFEDASNSGFRSEGGVNAIAALLHAGDDETVRLAAEAIAEISAASDAYDDIFRDAGAIPPLVVVLRRGAESGAAGFAASALMNLACNDENTQAIFEAGAVQPLVALLRAGNMSAAADHAAGALRNLAAGCVDDVDARSNRANAMHAAGAIPLLVELLRPDGEDESCTAEKYAAGAIQNLALV